MGTGSDSPDPKRVGFGTAIGGSGNRHYESENDPDELEDALEQKDNLLKEMHHRVKNNLQVVSSLLGVQKRPIDHDPCREILEICKRRIRSIAQVHKQLHQNEDVSRVNIQTFFTNLISEIKNLYDLSDDAEISTELESAVLEYDRAIGCCLVLYELLDNAIEHGIPDMTPA